MNDCITLHSDLGHDLDYTYTHASYINVQVCIHVRKPMSEEGYRTAQV